MDISVELCNKRLKNPTILASGILGMNADIIKQVVRGGAGAVTLKSTGIEPREGHPNPKVLVWEHGLANCYGLTNQGIGGMDSEWEQLKGLDVPVIASVFGAEVSEFVKVADYMAQKKADMIEVNVSCPNTKEHGMAFGLKKESCSEVVSAVKDAVGKIPVIAKLTPQALDIAGVAKAAEEAGADAISAINTVGPGMFINIDVAKPILSYRTGGLSGPAIRPIAVRCVYDIYKSVNIPIIGIGGVTYGKDAIELMMAGARAVGIGSAAYYRGIDVFASVSEELEAWLENSGYSSLKDIVGAAHG
jgi:dihydroorotate dehydrogenase (NAD+) catalytic subunit